MSDAINCICPINELSTATAVKFPKKNVALLVNRANRSMFNSEIGRYAQLSYTIYFPGNNLMLVNLKE